MKHSKHLVYISHPSGGLEENTLDTEKYIIELYSNDELYNNFCFVSPIHCYGFMYNTTEYYKGLSFCTDLLERCDIMIICGDWESSTGCREEKALCERLNIPYIVVKTLNELKNKISNGLCNDMLKLINK